MLKKYLEGLLHKRAPGPYSSFSITHLIKTLALIKKMGPIGRKRLSIELGMGEGATRNLISRLKDAGLITVSKSGCSLSSKGKKIWSEFESIFPKKVKLEESEFTLATYDVAILIRGHRHKVKTGIRQRDVAVMAGAKGASTLIFRNKKLTLPTISENVASDFPKAYVQITNLFRLEENDVVIIVSADTINKAEYGVLAAAWSLVNEN